MTTTTPWPPPNAPTCRSLLPLSMRCSMRWRYCMALVQLQHAVAAAAVIPFASRSATGLPSCTRHARVASSSRLEHDKSTPGMLPTCKPAYGAVHRLVCFPCWLGASSSAIQQHETRDLTRPITTHNLVLRVCAPQWQVAALLSRLHPTTTWSWSWVGRTLQTAV